MYCCYTIYTEEPIKDSAHQDHNLAIVTNEDINLVKPIEEPVILAVENNKPKTQTIMVAGNSVLITLPTVPKVIEVENNQTPHTRKIKFSKRTPPNYVPHSFDLKLKAKKEAPIVLVKQNNVGEIHEGLLSAYLRGAYIEVASVEKKLRDAGFEILASPVLNEDKTLTSILFTDTSLLQLANKENKEFMAYLRILIDKKSQSISITNPLYLAKGYLQKNYDKNVIQNVLKKIRSTFLNLKNSDDSLKFQLLSKYHFMLGMPYYNDMIEVASAKNLLEKIKNNDHVIFSKTLENKSTILAVTLSKETSKFIDVIGRKNAAVLPYTIVIQNNTARILDPKYYIALMYPKLSMSEFMAITDIPDAIVKDCENIFN